MTSSPITYFKVNFGINFNEEQKDYDVTSF